MSIADEKYVSLTTFRRNGDAVPTPVWIAPLATGTAGFTTGARSGKVKRIRNNPRVVLRPCDMRGRVAEGAVEVHATASVLMGGDVAPVEQAIKRKYGLMFRLMSAGSKVKAMFAKGVAEEDCAVHLRFD